MPELWLPYGDVEVAIDIKAENLGEFLQPRPSETPESYLREKIAEFEIKTSTSFVLIEAGEPSLRLIDALITDAQAKASSFEAMTVLVPKRRLTAAKKVCEKAGVKVAPLGAADTRVGKIDYAVIELPGEIVGHDNVLVSEVVLDSMFGFGGGPSSLCGLMNKEIMQEAFSRRTDDLPHPGSSTPCLDFAVTASSSIGQFTSLEIVAQGSEIKDLFFGEMIETHRKASDRAKEVFSAPIKEPAKIVAAAPGFSFDDTLASTLKSAWNVLGGLKEKGWLLLAGECGEGLGSEALELYVTGRLRIEKAKYVAGMEQIVFLQEVMKMHTLVLVSTLPKYHVEGKLGVRTAKRLDDSLQFAIDSLGSRTKAHVISACSQTLLVPGGS